jgi:hypothetical protein
MSSLEPSLPVTRFSAIRVRAKELLRPLVSIIDTEKVKEASLNI